MPTTTPRVALSPVWIQTLQNIQITHGGYKRALVEGIRQTVRRGANESSLAFDGQLHGFPRGGRLRWPQTNGIGMASVARSSNIAKLRGKQYLRKDNTRCALVLKSASQICRAVCRTTANKCTEGRLPRFTDPTPAPSWIVPLCYS
jgi:hypothetical protein